MVQLGIYEKRRIIIGVWIVTWLTIGVTFLVLSLKTNANTWEYYEGDSSFPQPRDAHTAVVFSDEMYIFGGLLTPETGELANDLWKYEIGDKKWKKIFSSCDIEPRYAHSAIMYNKYMVIFNGNTGAGPINDMWTINLKNTSDVELVVQGNQGPINMVGHSAISYQNSMIVFGGSLSIYNCATYNFETGVWTNCTKGSSQPQPRTFHACASHGSDMYIFGGKTSTGAIYDMWRLDLTQLTWHSIALQGAPDLVYPLTASTIHNTIYIIGFYTIYNDNTMYSFFPDQIDPSAQWQEVKYAHGSDDFSNAMIQYCSHTSYNNDYLILFAGSDTNHLWRYNIGTSHYDIYFVLTVVGFVLGGLMVAIVVFYFTCQLCCHEDRIATPTAASAMKPQAMTATRRTAERESVVIHTPIIISGPKKSRGSVASSYQERASYQERQSYSDRNSYKPKRYYDRRMPNQSVERSNSQDSVRSDKQVLLDDPTIV